jgi:hypothetical protein
MSFILSIERDLGTLAAGLGCFSLDRAAANPAINHENVR